MRGLMLGRDGYFAEGENEYLTGTIQRYQLKALIASEVFENSTQNTPKRKNNSKNWQTA